MPLAKPLAADRHLSPLVDRQAAVKSQYPLKWVNRVIMWCADKMPSFVQKAEAQAIECKNPNPLLEQLVRNS